MKRMVQVSLLLVLLLGLAGCIWITDDSGDSGYNFNGDWSFALTNCQRQAAVVEIFQNGTDFNMVSGGYSWFGGCDPFAATFSARTDGPWGFWTFTGGANGPDTMAGTYVYVEYRSGECTGTFTATRIGYRAADVPPGPGLIRRP